MMRRSRAASPAFSAMALLATAALVFACQQLLSIDGQVTVKGAGACNLAVEAGACQACVAASCCVEATVCAKNPGCASYESCLLGCGTDYACRARCVADTPAVTGDDVPVLDQCVVTHCESACGVSCGAVGSYAEPDAAVACQECIQARACQLAEACGTNLDCEKLGHCAIACFTNDCEAACESAYPDAGMTFTSLLFGVGSTCLTACSVGNYWECAGKVTWPLAKSANITVTLNIVASGAPSGVAGLTVKACDSADVTCAHPLAMQTTDAQGNAALALPPVTTHTYGFSGYFDISGPGVEPYLYFLSFPLSEPQASLSMLLLTPDAFTSLTGLIEVPGPDGGKVPFVPDDTRGTVVVAAGDCYHNGAPSVSIDAVSGTDGQTLETYLSGSALSATATMTDRSGLAFFLDAPTSTTLQLRATPQDIGRPSSTVTVFARAKTISFVQAFPTPQ